MDLTEEGVPTANGGRLWQRSTIQSIHSFPSYAGDAAAWRSTYTKNHQTGGWIIRRNDAPVELPPGAIEPLISRGQFDAVQTRLTRNKAEAVRNNHSPEDTLLRAGFARCGYCGGALTVARTVGRVAYRCSPHRLEPCPQFSIDPMVIDAEVWSRLEGFLTQPELVAERLAELGQDDPTIHDLAVVDRALAVVTRQQKNLVENLTRVTGTAADLVTERLGTLEKQRARIEAERATILQRQFAWQASQQQLTDLESWCKRVAGSLTAPATHENVKSWECSAWRCRV
jgi:hypothetical protein